MAGYGMDWAFRRIIRYADMHGLKVLISNDIKSEGQWRHPR